VAFLGKKGPKSCLKRGFPGRSTLLKGVLTTGKTGPSVVLTDIALAMVYDAKWGHYVEATTSACWTRVKPLLKEDACLLDVGCGTGAFFQRLKEDHVGVARMLGVDISPNMLAVAAKKVPEACFLEGSASIGGMSCIQSASVDVAVSVSSFHFWPDPVAGLIEIHKKLKPRGLLVLVDWNHEYWWCKLLGAYLWIRGFPGSTFYSSQQAINMVSAAGFTVLSQESIVVAGWGMFCVVSMKQDE
jgi:ubiquinone/menaquinone biosynthesis C-methylase UbiE